MINSDGSLPDRETLTELMEAERTRALLGIMPPWAYFVLSLVCAAGVWLPNETAATAVAVTGIFVPGLHMMLRIRPLAAAITVYDLDDAEESAADRDSTPADEAAAQHLAARMIGGVILVVSVVMVLAALLIPMSWLRTALPLACLWFALDLYRARGRRRHSDEVISRAAGQDWYPAYTRFIEARRTVLA
ncbi:hypothetical protein ACWFQ8_31805 [Streptomyces sp. NPDC055254]